MNNENESAINSRLAEVLNANVGNKITPELSAGLQGTLQQLMNTIACEAYEAGAASVRKTGDSVVDEVIDVETKD
ncbi:hypothetical protein [Comamonas sp. GB3 AK4-5]|uniref:hypothetical protein n=1 Tax=Comamonas sp. GB3 AK4-5 TaxID=3231487 RepID=UPI00351EDBC9